MRPLPWIVICTNPKIGAPWAFADRDDLRANLSACGWTSTDVDELLNAENPQIYDALALIDDGDTSEYFASDGCAYRVFFPSGEVEYIRATSA